MKKEHSKIYRMYVDESGDHTYSEDKRYLGLTGVIFESQNYKDIFHPSFEEFKEKHFPYNPDDPVILHRREILDKSGPFWRLQDKKNTSLLMMILSIYLRIVNLKLLLW